MSITDKKRVRGRVFSLISTRFSQLSGRLATAMPPSLTNRLCTWKRSWVENPRAVWVPAILIASLSVTGVVVVRQFEWEPTRALYLLSGVGQAMAAVLALCFSMVLVSAQFASQYSPRLLSEILDREAAILAGFLGLCAVLPFWLTAAPSATAVLLVLLFASGAVVWLVSYLLRLPRRLSPEARVLGLSVRVMGDVISGTASQYDAIKALDGCLVRALSTQDFDTFELALRQMFRLLQFASMKRASEGPSYVHQQLLKRLMLDLSLAATVQGCWGFVKEVFTSACEGVIRQRDEHLAEEFRMMLGRLHEEHALSDRAGAAGDATMLLGVLGRDAAKAGWHEVACSIAEELPSHTVAAERQREPLLFWSAFASLGQVGRGALEYTYEDDSDEDTVPWSVLPLFVWEGLEQVIRTLVAVESEAQNAPVASSGEPNAGRRLPVFQKEGQCLLELGAAALDRGWESDAEWMAIAVASFEHDLHVCLEAVDRAVARKTLPHWPRVEGLTFSPESLKRFASMVLEYRLLPKGDSIAT